MKSIVAVLSVLAASSAVGNSTPTLTVQDLYQSCQRNEIFCLAYIAGVFDAVVIASAATRDPVTGVCPDTGTTYGAAQQAFINWAPKHPELWSKFPYMGVVLALQATWPCPLVLNK